MTGNNAVRLSTVLLAAVLVNVIMFSIIQYMVGNRRIRLADTTEFDIANFIRMQEQSREVRSRRDPQAPEKPETDMQQDLQNLAQASTSGGIGGLAVNMPVIDIDIDVGGGIQLARELTPLVRVPPEYPARAMASEIEGFVILRFTVTETGAVADPEIIQSVPPGVFDREARRAVLRWKYQPQLVNGKPAAVITYTKINFQLLDE